MQIYLVGGALRDTLLGIDCADKDYVVVGATKEQMLSLGYSMVGNDFPVFLHPQTKEEYALARTERKTDKGHQGFAFDFDKNITLEQDLIRRDLTINAIAKDEAGNIIDPYGGIADLKQKVLRHISPAFCEDPLRVLRVARFYAKLYPLGFVIAKETLELMRQMVARGDLNYLTPERVFMELKKALLSPAPEQFVYALRKVGALKEVLPEVDKLFGIPNPAYWHPEIDSGIHTCITIKVISKFTQDPVVRFAMLCHDLGKGETPTVLWPCHKLHDILGEKPLKCLCQRLKVPSDYEQFAKIVVLNHSTMHSLYDKGAKGVVDLFYKIDAFRKPERVEPFALCCKCDYLGRKGFEDKEFPRYEYFLKLFEILKKVEAQEFIQRGLSGIDIKNAIYQKRIALTEDFLTTLPASENAQKKA